MESRPCLKVHFQRESFFVPLRASAIAEAERGEEREKGINYHGVLRKAEETEEVNKAAYKADRISS